MKITLCWEGIVYEKFCWVKCQDKRNSAFRTSKTIKKAQSFDGAPALQGKEQHQDHVKCTRCSTGLLVNELNGFLMLCSNFKLCQQDYEYIVCNYKTNHWMTNISGSATILTYKGNSAIRPIRTVPWATASYKKRGRLKNQGGLYVLTGSTPRKPNVVVRGIFQ